MENIDITLEQPNVDNVNSVLTGPQGPKGDPGEPGKDGVSPTITIGSVTSLPSGSSPSVTNSGSEDNVILNFGIPQGAKGDTGNPGANGSNGEDGVSPTISIGTTTTLDPNETAYVENVGTSSDVVLNFGIPQGVQGESADCLSVPTIVSELPEVGDPQKFYFVPVEKDITTVTGSSVSMTIGAEKVGRIDDLEILGEIEQSTLPATPEALTGIITFTINGDDYTVDLGDIYLAKVSTHQDKIYNVGNDFYIHREIGYIENYDGEDLDGADYISTSGALTTGDEVYYDLQDPTDTLIEDENLINSLRIIRNLAYPVGSNTIATSANVTAEISVGYYEVDPNSQYQKYVYMIDTANYEEIGGMTEIPDGSITTDKLDDSAVTSTKLADSSVTTNKLDDSSVTSSKIDDGAVSTSKLENNAVTSAKVNTVSHPVNSTYTIASGYVVTGTLIEKAGVLVGNIEARKSDYSNFSPNTNVSLATGGPLLDRYQIPLTAFFTSDSSIQEWGTDDVIGYGYFGANGSIEFRAPSATKGSFNYVRFHVVLPLKNT